jgi:hypothetical protein
MSLPLLGAGMATDGFSPLSISGLQFWVDAADAATLYTDSTLTTLAVSDGDVIGGWKDKSGNSRNALQTDGTKKPLLKLAIQNGRNVVQFTLASSNFLSFFSGPSILNTTSFFVIKTNGYNSQTILGVTPYTNPYWVLITNYGFVQGPEGLNSGFAYSTICDLYVVRYSASQNQVRKNGVDGTNNTSISGTNLISHIGSTGGGGDNYGGNIMEILTYNSVLNSGNILLVEAYLKAKWGTP